MSNIDDLIDYEKITKRKEAGKEVLVDVRSPFMVMEVRKFDQFTFVQWLQKNYRFSGASELWDYIEIWFELMKTCVLEGCTGYLGFGYRIMSCFGFGLVIWQTELVNTWLNFCFGLLVPYGRENQNLSRVVKDSKVNNDKLLLEYALTVV